MKKVFMSLAIVALMGAAVACNFNSKKAAEEAEAAATELTEACDSCTAACDSCKAACDSCAAQLAETAQVAE